MARLLRKRRARKQAEELAKKSAMEELKAKNRAKREAKKADMAALGKAKRANPGSSGLASIHYVSGSISSSHWQSLNTLFYTSGSPTYISESKFYYNTSNFTLNNQFLNYIYRVESFEHLVHHLVLYKNCHMYLYK